MFNDANHADLVADFPTSGSSSVTVDPNSWILCAKQGGAYGLNLITTSLPTVNADSTVADTLIARGGTLPYTWQALDALPPTTTLDASTGVISGTPNVPGNYSFRVKVTDHSSPVKSDTQLITWTIQAGDTSVGPVVQSGLPGFHISPNPSASSVLFSVSSAPSGPVEFRVFDLAGRMVASNVSAGSSASRSWSWDGHDASGKRLPAGVYWARVQVGSGASAWTERGKVLLLK